MLSTPPLAPKTLTALAHIGIHTLADLREQNPCRAFLLLKQLGRGGITQSVFWQLVGLVENTPAHALTAEQRTAWQQRLQQHPPVALFPPPERMAYFMQMALAQAEQAMHNNEIPVGAVVVHQDRVIAMAHNRCLAEHSVCHHAEIQAIMQAGKALQNYRLHECDLYVSLEPCAMCAGAIIQARIRRLIYATAEPKTGAAGSITDLFALKSINAHTAVLGGVLAESAQQLLHTFFQQRRLSRVSP